MLTKEQVQEYAAKIAELASAQEREDYLRSLNVTNDDDQRAIAEEVAYILRDKAACDTQEVQYVVAEEQVVAES